MKQTVFNIEKILGFCETVCYFLAVNLLFLVSVFPALLFLLFVGASQIRECLPLFLLSLVPAAPALSAVFTCMNRVVRGVSGSAFSDYRQGYTDEWLLKLRLGAGNMFALFILWNNTEFFFRQLRILPLCILFGFLFAAAVLASPTIYLLASRYRMGGLQTVKAAAALFFTKPVAAVGNTAALAVCLMLFELWPGTAVLFIVSVFCFLIAFMDKGMLRELEERS